jgi:hypothetical protein
VKVEGLVGQDLYLDRIVAHAVATEKLYAPEERLAGGLVVVEQIATQQHHVHLFSMYLLLLLFIYLFIFNKK